MCCDNEIKWMIALDHIELIQISWKILMIQINIQRIFSHMFAEFRLFVIKLVAEDNKIEYRF